ncbi:MAG: hypothetical protein R3308_03865 [Thiohalobacterales bacterium]|nr:hypothetical protein [Thiohalobacterales bacterium]
MSDRSTPDDAQEPAVVLGRLTFARLREEADARSRAQRLARMHRKNAIHKRLMTRILNRENRRPELHIIK